MFLVAAVKLVTGLYYDEIATDPTVLLVDSTCETKRASRGFEVTTTPAMRMVLSLEDWDDSRWVSLTGVSGHPTSSHYTDQTDLLVAGGTLPFLFSPEAVADAADSELTLRPAP